MARPWKRREERSREESCLRRPHGIRRRLTGRPVFSYGRHMNSSRNRMECGTFKTSNLSVLSCCSLNGQLASRYCYQLYLILINVVKVFMISLAPIKASLYGVIILRATLTFCK